MEAKENRPDACTASGTAKSIYKYFSTDAPDIQEEKGWLCLPDDCAADIVSFCEEQSIAYDNLLAYAALSYLQGIDPENPPARDTLKFELLTLTNSCIDAYNLGKRDPNAPVGAKQKDAYPDQKQGAERYKRLSGLHFLQIAIVLRELHHAIGIPCNRADDDGNFDIGVYQESGLNKGCYDTTEEALTRLIRSYNMTITTKGVAETVATLRDICEKKRACTDKDLVAVNNGIYDYGHKILMGFDPELVFLAKSHIDFVNHAPNPVIHNGDDGTDWDVVSWMNELSDDPEIVKLLWQIIGAVIRPNVSWNKSAWFYSTLGNNGKGTLCVLMRNLCGSGAWASIPLKNFSEPFMLEPLTRVSAVITDENDTGTFVDDAAALKSVITGDPFQLNRKFKAPRNVLFRGFMIQCVNELPKLRDKSESMYRRLLVIPFDKRFQGRERKYIKDDYLNRQDVLEYVLYHVLAETDYYELDEPDACSALLDDFRVANDPLRQFADEIFPAASWHLLPCKFLYDLYRHWFQRNQPSGRMLGRNAFYESIEGLAEEQGWQLQERVRSTGRMDFPEPLILEYEVKEWMNPTYRGSDPDRVCTPDPKDSYRGYVRISTAFFDGGYDIDDSTNKEE